MQHKKLTLRHRVWEELLSSAVRHRWDTVARGQIAPAVSQQEITGPLRYGDREVTNTMERDEVGDRKLCRKTEDESKASCKRAGVVPPAPAAEGMLNLVVGGVALEEGLEAAHVREDKDECARDDCGH